MRPTAAGAKLASARSGPWRAEDDPLEPMEVRLGPCRVRILDPSHSRHDVVASIPECSAQRNNPRWCPLARRVDREHGKVEESSTHDRARGRRSWKGGVRKGGDSTQHPDESSQPSIRFTLVSQMPSHAQGEAHPHASDQNGEPWWGLETVLTLGPRLYGNQTARHGLVYLGEGGSEDDKKLYR